MIDDQIIRKDCAPPSKIAGGAVLFNENEIVDEISVLLVYMRK